MKNLRYLALAFTLCTSTSVAQDMVLLAAASQSSPTHQNVSQRPSTYPGPCFVIFGTEAINTDDVYRIEIFDRQTIRIHYLRNNIKDLSIPQASTPMSALVGTVLSIENCRKLKTENEQKGKVK